MRILGCDPGLFGAVALYDTRTSELTIRDAPIARIKVGKSDNRAVYLDAAYAAIFRELAPDEVRIEKVGGLTGQSASASFNFGAGYGLLRGCAAMMAVPVEFVPPSLWKSRLRVPPGKDGSRARACALFPRYADLFARVKDDGRAEAALIAVCPL